jgi:hypothetical protein
MLLLSYMTNCKSPLTSQKLIMSLMSRTCASIVTLKGCIQQVTMISHPRFGCNITLDLGTVPNIEQFMITTGFLPNYSCPYFKGMLTKSLGKQGQWTNCKHLYFIFTIICNLDCEVDVFTHAPSFSFKEVKRILENGVLNHLS